MKTNFNLNKTNRHVKTLFDVFFRWIAVRNEAHRLTTEELRPGKARCRAARCGSLRSPAPYPKFYKNLGLPLNGDPLVEKHGEFTHKVEHEHDANGHQHHPGPDLDQADILAEALKGHQKLMKQ